MFYDAVLALDPPKRHQLHCDVTMQLGAHGLVVVVPDVHGPRLQGRCYADPALAPVPDCRDAVEYRVFAAQGLPGDRRENEDEGSESCSEHFFFEIYCFLVRLVKIVFLIQSCKVFEYFEALILKFEL